LNRIKALTMKSVTKGSPAARQAQEAWLLGRSLGQRGAWSDAAARYRQAVRLQPDDVLYGLNLADALLKAGRSDEAAQAARDALKADPSNALATTLCVRALMSALRYEEVVEVVTSAPAQHLGAELWVFKGVAEFKLGRARDAVQSFLRAAALQPHDATIHYRLGLALNELSLKREAAECFRTALLLGLGPLEVGVRDLLAFYEREVCDWQGGDTQVRELKASIARLADDAALQTNPFAHVTLLDEPLEQLKAARACARHIAQGVRPLSPRRPQRREKIRVGYVSADFHRHATSFLMAQLFEQHDRQRFEIYAYSHGRDDGSAVRARIQAACDHFVDAQRMTVSAMARQIQDDGIDILIDLKGYTQDARPALFAYRAAPVQAAYLGFPGTSGAESIDYIIGDPWVTPMEHAAHYSEKIAQLPGCYQCNDGTRPVPVAPSRSSQGLPEDALVLCGFNQPYKISPEVFDVWCRVLQQVPAAVLWLLEWHPQAPNALRREAMARGVDPSRLIFAPTVTQEVHLNRIGCADLFIDTWPCNGHTTASDMLWAGVPVITFSGRTFASRVAGSLLKSIGLDDMVLGSEAEYQELVVALVQDRDRLERLKAEVCRRRSEAKLFDSRFLTPQLEGLFERMWARALAGQAPGHLPAL
jgi:predicted O-linked N-acetylglucosamine transferase (SPINDLY family)